MPSPSPAAALLRADARGLVRDTLLLPLLLGAPLLVVVLRFGFPPLSAWLHQRFGVDLAAHHPFILGALLVVDVPMNAGAVLALLVLDERDERTLAALGVTPLGLGGYVRYRLASAAVLGGVLPALSLPLTGLAPLDVLWRAAPALLAAALVAPLAGCAVLLLAADKVQGLAVMKVAGLVWALPLLTWFVDAPWARLLLLVPTGAPLQALWSVLEGGSAWPAALAGGAWTALLLTALAGPLRRRLGPG